jgi:hypothetical protein
VWMSPLPSPSPPLPSSSSSTAGGGSGTAPPLASLSSSSTHQQQQQQPQEQLQWPQQQWQQRQLASQNSSDGGSGTASLSLPSFWGRHVLPLSPAAAFLRRHGGHVTPAVVPRRELRYSAFGGSLARLASTGVHVVCLAANTCSCDYNGRCYHIISARIKHGDLFAGTGVVDPVPWDTLDVESALYKPRFNVKSAATNRPRKQQSRAVGARADGPVLSSTTPFARPGVGSGALVMAPHVAAVPIPADRLRWLPIIPVQLVPGLPFLSPPAAAVAAAAARAVQQAAREATTRPTTAGAGAAGASAGTAAEAGRGSAPDESDDDDVGDEEYVPSDLEEEDNTDGDGLWPPRYLRSTVRPSSSSASDADAGALHAAADSGGVILPATGRRRRPSSVDAAAQARVASRVRRDRDLGERHRPTVPGAPPNTYKS